MSSWKGDKNHPLLKNKYFHTLKYESAGEFEFCFLLMVSLVSENSLQYCLYQTVNICGYNPLKH